jgi:hypothetical protein
LITNLTDFLSVSNQEIAGEVFLSDIYEIFETTPGVLNSKIDVLQPQPAALVFGETTTQLAWTRALNPASTAIKSFRIVFNSSTVFQLYRENIYLGNFTVGTLVETDEVDFTVTAAAYVTGDMYTFKTYPYFGGFKLEEFSIPITFSGNITLNMQGGI